MKNKMKLWRKEAPAHHQGRKNKSANFKWRKSVLMSDLLKALFARIGMSPVDIAVREKVKELEAA